MLPYKRPYLILKDELLVIKKYINEHLNKGFILLSMLLAAAPILLNRLLIPIADLVSISNLASTLVIIS